jgi:hypothetical protein
MPGNMTPAEKVAFTQNNVLDLGFSVQSGSSNKMVGMSFTEQAPVNSPNSVANIQVTAVVVMNDGSGGWSFNDLLSTLPPGTIPPAPAEEYDGTVIIPSDPPYTLYIKGIPEANLSA